MSSTIFLIIALVTTGIFVIQFILSIFFGDIDADVDVDTDISSVVSFKGLTHFGIGFGWYMYLAGNTEIQTYAVAIFVGLCFVLAVWFLYKKAFQLQQVNRSEQTEQLVGRECTIYFKQNDGRYTVQTKRDARSGRNLRIGKDVSNGRPYGYHPISEWDIVYSVTI